MEFSKHFGVNQIMNHLCIMLCALKRPAFNAYTVHNKLSSTIVFRYLVYQRRAESTASEILSVTDRKLRVNEALESFLASAVVLGQHVCVVGGGGC